MRESKLKENEEARSMFIEKVAKGVAESRRVTTQKRTTCTATLMEIKDRRDTEERQR